MRKILNISPLLIFVSIPMLVGVIWRVGDVSAVHASGDPIVVIVNEANPIENLSMSELRRIFLSENTHWDTGKPVLPVIVAEGALERKFFLKIVCSMSDADFNRYFLRASYAGRSATPPKEVYNSAALKRFVATTPGAIGFVKALDFHGNGSDGGVKAIRVDGLTGTDIGYKLRM